MAYLVAACIIAVSPGSGAVLSMSHGLSYGVRKTSATILGLQLGLLLILLIAGAGVGSLLIASETAFNAVKIVGACYLIYIGFAQWRAKGGIIDTEAEQPASGSWQKRALSGFLTNATNPKGIIFMVAVLPQFMTTERPLLRDSRAMRIQNKVFGGLLMLVGLGLFFVKRTQNAA